VSCDLARDDAVLLFVSSSGHGKRTPVASFNRQGRGGQGVRGMRINESRGSVVAAFTVDAGMEVLVFSSAGNIVRMGVDEISEQGRDATGVRVARLDEGDTVVAVAPVLEAENDESPVGDFAAGDADSGDTASEDVAPGVVEGEEN
jgi:DNA gyrase subunit A